jgi:hypothetical protein
MYASLLTKNFLQDSVILVRETYHVVVDYMKFTEM